MSPWQLKVAPSAIAVLLIVFSSDALQAAIVTCPPDLAAGSEYHLAFVTGFNGIGYPDGTTSAGSSDIAVYNEFVNTQASYSSDLDGIAWYAIGSTATVDARDNAKVVAPVYRLDGTRVADGFSDMWDGQLLNAIKVDQHGVDVTTYGNSNRAWTFVFTGSDTSGQKSTPLGGSDTHPHHSEVGRPWHSDAEWIQWDHGPYPNWCEGRFYGLSEPLRVPGGVIPEPSSMIIWSLLGAVVMAAASSRRKHRRLAIGLQWT